MSKRARSSEKHLKVARDVLLNGKSFRQAAVSAGYSENCAKLGPAQMRAEIPGLNNAFLSVSKGIEWHPTALRQVAVNRIASTCCDDKNSDNLKAAELIGRFKSVDLFVRNGDAQVGIFFGAVEASDNDIASLVPHNPETRAATEQESQKAGPETDTADLD